MHCVVRLEAIIIFFFSATSQCLQGCWLPTICVLFIPQPCQVIKYNSRQPNAFITLFELFSFIVFFWPIPKLFVTNLPVSYNFSHLSITYSYSFKLFIYIFRCSNDLIPNKRSHYYWLDISCLLKFSHLNLTSYILCFVLFQSRWTFESLS